MVMFLKSKIRRFLDHSLLPPTGKRIQFRSIRDFRKFEIDRFSRRFAMEDTCNTKGHGIVNGRSHDLGLARGAEVEAQGGELTSCLEIPSRCRGKQPGLPKRNEAVIVIHQRIFNPSFSSLS